MIIINIVHNDKTGVEDKIAVNRKVEFIGKLQENNGGWINSFLT